MKSDQPFLEKLPFLCKDHWILICYLIHFKSQHIVVRAVYGLSVAIFGFALNVLVFEILFFWENDSFFSKNESFCQNIDIVLKPIQARANPKRATESL